MKPKINLEKFICSYVKWNNIQDALKDQGLKCWNGEIVEIESEDERMKKEILDLVSISGNGNQFEEIKDWLEKQGKQKPFDYETATIIQKDFAPKEVTCTQEVETGNGNIKALVTQKCPAESLGISPEKYNEIVNECIYGEEKSTDKVEQNLSNSPEIGKNDTLLDLLHKMPSYITVDGIDYHFVMKKTIAYMVYYEALGEGCNKTIFWTGGDPVDILTEMLEKLKEEGLLE